jgi:hypothetical protein
MIDEEAGPVPIRLLSSGDTGLHHGFNFSRDLLTPLFWGSSLLAGGQRCRRYADFEGTLFEVLSAVDVVVHTPSNTLGPKLIRTGDHEKALTLWQAGDSGHKHIAILQNAALQGFGELPEHAV